LILAGEETVDAIAFRESSADYGQKAQRASELKEQASKVSTTDQTPQDKATLSLMQRELDLAISLYALKAHLRPSISPASPDFNVTYLANAINFDSEAGAKLYLDRLQSFPGYISDICDNLKAGAETGYAQPKLVLENAGLQSANNIKNVDPADSVWMSPFKRCAGADRPEISKLAEQAKTIIETELLPSIKGYANLLTDNLAPRGKESISCADGPDGEAYYALLCKQYTSLDQTPDQIHSLGLEEVDRLKEEMTKVAKKAGYDDATSYRDFITNDPSFIAESTEALRKQAESLCKRIDGRIPNFFAQVPRNTYGVDMIPEALSASMPPAYAQPGAADGSSPGMFWVNGLIDKVPSYILPSMALHEAWPGHLMHIALIQEQQELPKFRRFGALKYTACVEGWALYCESIGDEFGLYENPEVNFGRLDMEMWRAVRLVVDTGIHNKGWSRM